MADLKTLKNKYLTASDGDVLGVTDNKDNVSLLGFKLAAADSLTKFNLKDGFIDAFEDTSGVDSGNSSSATRNAASYYSGTSSGSGDATGNAATNNITVARNGHNIQGSSADLTISTNRAAIGLVYVNVAQGWVLIEN